MDLFDKLNINGIAVLDFETTGLNPEKDYPIEVAIKKVGFSPVTYKIYKKEYTSKIKLPEGVEVPEFITNLTGLTTKELNETGNPLWLVSSYIHRLIDDSTLIVAHNANFDLGFLFHHMGIAPKYFMCTRTISILTEPDKNASLKNVYARMFGEKTQAHRAGDDVEMTMKVFENFVEQLGNDSMMFFVNKVVNMPDRELVFVPHNAVVLDFTKKYASSNTAEKLTAELEAIKGVMSEEQYRKEIDRTMKPMGEKEKLAMLGMGIAGEAGEIADSLKKVVFHGHELDREDLIKELGDLEWYVTHLKKLLNISSDYVRMKNIEKLKKRYPNGFSEQDSINRTS